MKLYFQQSEFWQPERYHYAAEQMMLTAAAGKAMEMSRRAGTPAWRAAGEG